MQEITKYVCGIKPLGDRVEQQQHSRFLHERHLLAHELAGLAVLGEPPHLAMLYLYSHYHSDNSSIPIYSDLILTSLVVSSP